MVARDADRPDSDGVQHPAILYAPGGRRQWLRCHYCGTPCRSFACLAHSDLATVDPLLTDARR